MGTYMYVCVKVHALSNNNKKNKKTSIIYIFLQVYKTFSFTHNIFYIYIKKNSRLHLLFLDK